MKPTSIAKDKEHLEKLIKQEIQANGIKCSLNHIDVSNVTDMSYLFYESKFDGNISEWNVSKVRNMNSMFDHSEFNGDISEWNVSNVEEMHSMFYVSLFNGDISNWNVSNVKDMQYMFSTAKFKKDLCNWKPYELKDVTGMFDYSEILIPYWSKYVDIQVRKKVIDSYQLNKTLNEELIENHVSSNKVKI